MTAIHIMLDLETWGKTPGSDIRSIGATVFDPAHEYGGYVEVEGSKTFYIACDNPVLALTTPHFNHWDETEKVNRKYPLQRDPETVQWWNDQSQEAQGAFANPLDMWKALYEFHHWLWRVSRPTERFENWKPGEEVRLWCNGPNFDEAILAAAYRAVGLVAPWHYRSPRDMRTIVDAAGMTYEEMKEFNHGTAHNALDDAISQAMIVCECYKRLGLQK